MVTLIDKLPKVAGEYIANAELGKMSRFGVGGNAEVLYYPAGLDDLANFIKNVDKNIPITVIGGTSNLLIRDGGVKGVVIRFINQDSFDLITLENDKIIVGAGAYNFALARFALDNSITGFEFLSGIPGTVGGAIRGNAGAYGSDIAKNLISATVVDKKGNIIELSNKQLDFAYRHCGAPCDLIFVKAVFKAEEIADKDDILSTMHEMKMKREASQPFNERTCGSTFKNPKDLAAWKLIDEAGFRGQDYHGAKMSEKHPNFLVNVAAEKASYLEELGEMVIAKVYQNSGVKLEWEIKIIGEKLADK